MHRRLDRHRHNNRPRRPNLRPQKPPHHSPRHQQQEEQDPPISRPVPQHPQLVIPGQIHPSRRRHRRRDLGDIPRARRGDLRAALAGQQSEGDAGPEAALADGVGVLDASHADEHERLRGADAELPRAGPVAEERAALAGEVGAAEEARETAGGVRDGGSVVAVVAEEEADSEEDGVTGLGGVQTAVVDEGDCVLDAGDEGEA